MSVPTFIDLNVDDQTRELLTYLKELGAEVSDENVGQSAVKDIMQLVEASKVCWDKLTNDADIEMVFNGIISMMLVISAEENVEPVTTFCQNVAKYSKGDRKSPIRIRILSNLFYGLDEKSHLRADIYMHLLKLAKDAELPSMVVTDLNEVKKWISQWDVSTQTVQTIYRALHEILLVAKLSEQATKVMIELLGTYTEDNASQARDDAQRCIVTCLEDPNTFLLDHLLTLKPVKFLEGAQIHDLLTIFVTGKLSQYQQFYKNNASFITSLGLSHEENMRKMRVLTFMQMAETRKDLDYASIQKEMDISENEVEEFIIDVIKTKSIQAKIDQLQKKVLVTASTQRTFGRQQWQLLHQYLLRWQSNINNVQGSLRTLEMMQAQGQTIPQQ